MGKQVEALEDHADPQANLALNPASLRGSIMGAKPQAVYRDGSTLKCLQPVEATQERTLAAARSSNNRRHFAAPDREVHSLQNLDRSVPLDQVVHLDRAHATAPPFTPRAPNRLSDHRENQDRGKLIIIYRNETAKANSIAPP